MKMNDNKERVFYCFFSGNFQKIINAALLQQTLSFSLAEQFVLASFCFRIVFIS